MKIRNDYFKIIVLNFIVQMYPSGYMQLAGSYNRD